MRRRHPNLDLRIVLGIYVVGVLALAGALVLRLIS
jgi:hypothetical protein